MTSVIDIGSDLIKHNQMDIGKDPRTVGSLSRHILHQIVSSISEGVLLVDARDPDLRIVFANPAYEELTGYSADELVGTSWRLMKRGEEKNPELMKLRVAIGCAEPCQITVVDLRKDATSWSSEVSVKPLYGARGELRYFLCQQKPAAVDTAATASVEVDLLQRELGHARQRIASLSRTDAVTGLLNIEYFLSLLRRDLGLARRERRSILVVVFEIVEFDVYRRTFGSNAADSCLRMIGAQVAGAFRRAGDLCARCGESMMVVAARGQEESQVEALAARVVEKVRGLGLHNPRAASGRYLTVRSAMIGGMPDGEDAEQLVDRAKAQLRDTQDHASQRQAR